MATKSIKTRIQHKYDVEQNWDNASFTPLKGEIIFYGADETHARPRFKVGDGVTPIGQLPLVDTNVLVASGSKFEFTFDNLFPQVIQGYVGRVNNINFKSNNQEFESIEVDEYTIAYSGTVVYEYDPTSAKGSWTNDEYRTVEFLEEVPASLAAGLSAVGRFFKDTSIQLGEEVLTSKDIASLHESAEIVKEITTVDNGEVSSIHVAGVNIGYSSNSLTFETSVMNFYSICQTYNSEEVTIRTPGFISNGQKFENIVVTQWGDYLCYDDTYVVEGILGGWSDDNYRRITFQSPIDENTAQDLYIMGYEVSNAPQPIIAIKSEQITEEDISSFKSVARHSAYVDKLTELVDVDYDTEDAAGNCDALSIRNNAKDGVASILVGRETIKSVYIGTENNTDPSTPDPRVTVCNNTEVVNIGTVQTDSYGNPIMGLSINDTSIVEQDLKNLKKTVTVSTVNDFMLAKDVATGKNLPFGNNLRMLKTANIVGIHSEIVCMNNVFYAVFVGGDDPTGSTSGHSLSLVKSEDGINFSESYILANATGTADVHIACGDGLIFVSEQQRDGYSIYVSYDYGETFQVLKWISGGMRTAYQLAYTNGILAINEGTIINYLSSSDNFTSVTEAVSSAFSNVAIAAINNKFWIYDDDYSAGFWTTEDFSDYDRINVPGENDYLLGDIRQAFATDGNGTVTFLTNNGYVLVFKQEQYVAKFMISDKSSYFPSNITYGCGKFVGCGVSFTSDNYLSDVTELGGHGMRTGSYCGNSNMIIYVDDASDGGTVYYSYDGEEFLKDKYTVKQGTINYNSAFTSMIMPDVVKYNKDVFAIRDNLITDKGSIEGLKVSDVTVGLIDKTSEFYYVFPENMSSLLGYGDNTFLWTFNCKGMNISSIRVTSDMGSGYKTVVFMPESGMEFVVYEETPLSSSWVDDSYRYVTNFVDDGFIDAEIPGFMRTETITTKKTGIEVGGSVIKEGEIKHESSSIKLTGNTTSINDVFSITRADSYEIVDSFNFARAVTDVNVKFTSDVIEEAGIYYGPHYTGIKTDGGVDGAIWFKSDKGNVQAGYGILDNRLTFTEEIPSSLQAALDEYGYIASTIETASIGKVTLTSDGIKIGNTVLDETKLNKLLNFIDQVDLS